MEAKKSITVKEWADSDRPREKMLQKGKKELSNTELVAILVRSGMQGKSAVDVAQEVLRMAGNSLTTLSRLEYSQLAKIKGLGPVKAVTLLAALELGWRMQSEISDGKELIINDSNALFSTMLPILADLDHEEFWAVHLSVRNKLIGKQRIAMGGMTDVGVDLRILFRGAIESKATSIAIVHNHPSGHLEPSRQDRELTRRVEESGRMLGIKLMEHIIVGINPNGQANYYSFHDHGDL